MKLTKPEDSAAKVITFGVELETYIPSNAGVLVGSYHGGAAVRQGLSNGAAVAAPQFGGSTWRAERDASIQAESGYTPCEFVSPILHGDEGVTKLVEMVAFINRIGGKVNQSCGCHITVGIQSVIGTLDRGAVSDFCQKVAHIAQLNAWAIYAQTGTGRHLNHYSHVLANEVERAMATLVNSADTIRQETLVRQCGRGMVNFSKVFSHGVIEFRAFAGTLNDKKVLHHLATVLGVVRRAATVKTFGKFDRKATKKHSNIANAVEALRRMWRLLGWVDSVPGRDCALGLFGKLHAEFGTYRKIAVEMAEQFDTRFPNANL